jgi:asparaginyl-tRNA synthetase
MATPIDLPLRTKEPQKPSDSMAEAQGTIYIDEDNGKDDTSASGTEDKPYKTLVFAYVQTDGSASYLTRKAEPATSADGAASAPPEWKPAAKSVRL